MTSTRPHRTAPLIALTLAVLLTVFAALSSARAGTITSAPGGGLWTDGASWVGGIVPGGGDDVLIVSPIQVAGTAACLGLTVDAGGQLSAADPGVNTLVAGGSAVNDGVVQDTSTLFLYLEIGGDLTNHATWDVTQTTLTAPGETHLSMTDGAGFSTALVRSGSGDLVVDSPFHILGNVTLDGGLMVLQPGCDLTMDDGVLSGGEVRCNGNELGFVPWAYPQNCTIDSAVLVGKVQVRGLVAFTGGVTVRDTLQNLPSGGGSHVTVEGELVNEGVIRNDTYGLTMTLSGDLVNDGVIRNSYIQLDGTVAPHLSSGPSGLFDTNLFLQEFVGGTVTADTPLRFADGFSLAGGTMILSPGASLTFLTFGSLGGGELQAGGNEIVFSGESYGTLSDLVIDEATFRGSVQISADVSVTGDLTVTDTLRNRFGNAAHLTVGGRLRNEGAIHDNGALLAIRSLGDVVNEGTMTNGRVVLDGGADQAIAAGGGIGVAEFTLDSNLSAISYQWFKDGAPLGGETGVTLTLATVGASDYGVYHCEGTGTGSSRTFTIDELAVATSVTPFVSSGGTGTFLEGTRPNPFNPATEIAFTLSATGHARLAVYDVSGRLVDVLADGEAAAGRHIVSWRPAGLPSGVYLVRLDARGTSQVVKATLLE